MNKTIFSVALAMAALISAAVIHIASKRPEVKVEQIERRGKFKERLQRARESGEKKVRSGAVIPLYAQADLDTALSMYDLVIGEFVSSKSFAADGFYDHGSIVTWYKFKILETVSTARGHRISDIDSPPAELLPIASDEILIWKTGGAIEVDGIEIEMEEVHFPPFDKSKKYLLILGVDPAKQAGHVQVGPSGVLIVTADDTLEPVRENVVYFKRQIENRYGTSVSKLKAKLSS